jgi:hypothetical protein
MAATTPQIIIMAIFFAVLFFFFVPGNFLQLPNSSPKPDDMDLYIHSILFGVVATLTYEIAAHTIAKNI